VYLGRDPSSGQKRYGQLGGFRTRRAAELALLRLLEEHRVGADVASTDLSVGEFLTDWLAAIEPTVRASTMAPYRTMVRAA
jgi:hypothetical protein